MTNRELIDEILTLVRSESNNNPAPLKCKIIRNYPNNSRIVDVQINEDSIIRFVSVIGSNKVGSEAVIVFIDGKSEDMLVISPSGSSTSIDIDDELSNVSRNPVENRVITSSLENKSNKIHTHLSSDITDLEIDDELSNISTNPVENRVITNSLDNKSNKIHTHLSSDITDLIDIIYPVGAIYISANAVNPSTLFGGEWRQIEDRFLLAGGSEFVPTYDADGFANKTGGAKNVTLTANQSGLRAHGHGMAHNHNHRHTLGSDWSTGSGSGSGYIHTSNRSLTTKNSGYDNTASSKTTTDNNTSANATEAHENMPPYLVVNIWQRIR